MTSVWDDAGKPTSGGAAAEWQGQLITKSGLGN